MPKHTPINHRYQRGEFETEDDAKKAFERAYFDCLNQVNKVSLSECMGLTPEQLAKWIFSRELPPR